MKNTTAFTMQIESNLKKQFEEIVNDMGLSMSTAFHIFAKAVVRQGKIPFEIVGSTQSEPVRTTVPED